MVFNRRTFRFWEEYRQIHGQLSAWLRHQSAGIEERRLFSRLFSRGNSLIIGSAVQTFSTLRPVWLLKPQSRVSRGSYTSAFLWSHCYLRRLFSVSRCKTFHFSHLDLEFLNDQHHVPFQVESLLRMITYYLVTDTGMSSHRRKRLTPRPVADINFSPQAHPSLYLAAWCQPQRS